MVSMLRIDELDKLVLVWLLMPRKKPGIKALGRALNPFVEGTGAAAESIARQSLARLKSCRDIEGDTTWMVSPAGKEKALALLGVRNVPKRPTWPAMYGLLVAQGHAGKPTKEPLLTDVVGEVLWSQLGNQRAKPIHLKEIANGVAWRALGVESVKPFTLNAVLAHLAHDARPESKRPDRIATSLQILAATALGVPHDARSLRKAAKHRAVAAKRGSESSGARAPTQRPIATTQIEATLPFIPAEPPAPATSDDQASLRTFAEHVKAAARASLTGRWGDTKVFVAHVWTELHRGNVDLGMDLDAFKRALVRANQAGFLALSRADLVGSMNAEDVARSEISSLGATFHFISND